jgi:hypothetical protein
MNDWFKAFFAIQEKVYFLRKGGSDQIHVMPYTLAGQLGVSQECLRSVLTHFADRGILSMRTWRWDALREVSWQEWRSEEFFYNRDDANYVRLRLAQ